MSKLVNADELKSKLLEMGCIDGKPCYGAEIIDRMPPVQAVPIPDNATNGEIILSLFPTAETQADKDECCMKVHFPGAFNIECFDLVWWNDKYDDGNKEL